MGFTTSFVCLNIIAAMARACGAPLHAVLLFFGLLVGCICGALGASPPPPPPTAGYHGFQEQVLVLLVWPFSADVIVARELGTRNVCGADLLVLSNLQNVM